MTIKNTHGQNTTNNNTVGVPPTTPEAHPQADRKEPTKAEYLQARRLIRDNGRYAIRWMRPRLASLMDVLYWGQAHDRLAERAEIVEWCKREGINCTPRQTA